MQDITIYRDLPVIAGHVQVPPTNQRVPVEQALDTIAGATDVRVEGSVWGGMGASESTGRKFGRQRLFRLPGLKPGQQRTADPVSTLTGGQYQ
jgi:hypothetical protein